MTRSPVLNRVMVGLARCELAGVNPHTLAVALARLAEDQVSFKQRSEREVAMLLLERTAYPRNVNEFSVFLNLNSALTPSTLLSDEITSEHTPQYMRWLPAFLEDPEQNIQKNARILLRWLVANRAPAIAADQPCLDNMRRLADDTATSWRNSAYVVYALGCCGTLETDFDRVTHHAEQVIEQDRDRLDMVADGLYRLYPPALINALQYFLERTAPGAKHFATGMILLSKVAEIEDKAFWTTYYNEMDGLINNLSEIAGRNHAVERVLDIVEKHMALAAFDDEME